jgi:cytochrome c oxidase subunit 2
VKVPSNIATLIIGVLVTLASLWYGQNNGLLPAPASAQAPQIDRLFNVMLAISTGLFLIIQGALLYSLFTFRQPKGDNTDAQPIHGNVPLEILWTSIPAVIVLWLAIYSFDVYKAVDSGGSMASNHMAHASSSTEQVASIPGAAIAAPLPTAVKVEPSSVGAEQSAPDPATATVRNQEVPQRQEAPGLGVVSPQIGPTSAEKGKLPDLVVNVTGLQFAWIFTYPESGIVSGELHLPVDREVSLNISANDVIHAFWVPEFRLKQDAIPGRESHMRFKPTVLGEYRVICAELCGAYHGAMKTKVIVQAPEAYQSWVQSQKVATTSANQAIAINPADLPADQFLAPYTEEMGLNPSSTLTSDLTSMSPLAAVKQGQKIAEHL